MSLAAVIAAAALTAAPLELFHKLLRQKDPFAAASRLPATRIEDGVWRRHEGDGYVVELGPFVKRTPQKIVIATRFSTRADAAAYAGQIIAALPTAPNPRPPPEIGDYRGAIVIARRPIGLEIDLQELENEWRVTVTLIAGGSRIVVPIPSQRGSGGRGGGKG
ncbi:MAG TPA: hypothetical protein VGR02_06080 [Thermoanaerobaculia bacterium]|nr:hypothetical protein [Thermoanaerobaculia bacterium]